ncbi:MFS transporter [Kitasatospora sp. NPDC094019]|uniref:MFS transporter n=1 Tax=Kitasatospora sp. NPDC094019 TaxID=3364091 RepID=UPI00381F2D18
MFSIGGEPGSSLGRRFHLLCVSVTVSAFGDGMRFVALPLLAAGITGDPRDVTLVATAEHLPWLLLSLPAGALADRMDRRRLLFLVDMLRAVLVGGLVLAMAVGAVSVPLLAVVGFLLGCGQTFYNAGWVGAVPSVVAPGHRARANGRLQAGALVAEPLLGAPLGTVLFAAAVSAPFVLDAISFAAAALLVLGIRDGLGGVPRAERVTERRGSAVRHLCAEAGEGVRRLWRHRVLRALCLAACATNLVAGGVISVLVLYTRNVLHLGAEGYGALVAVFAVGGVLGSLAASRSAARLGSGWVLIAGPIGAAAALAGAGRFKSLLLVGICTFLWGALSMAYGIVAVSVRQGLVPEGLMGRVGMAHQMLANSGTAVGAALAGVLAHGFGLRSPFLAGAALLAVTGLLLVPVVRRGADAAEPVPASASG